MHGVRCSIQWDLQALDRQLRLSGMAGHTTLSSACLFSRIWLNPHPLWI